MLSRARLVSKSVRSQALLLRFKESLFMRHSNRRSQRLTTSDDYTQASFICPACGDRVLATKAENHLTRKHPKMSKSSFLELIKSALLQGAVRFELTGRHDATQNPTQRLAEVRKVSKGVQAVYRG